MSIREIKFQILIGSLGSIAVKSIYLIIQFCAGIILARTLGPEQLGIYVFIMALVQLLVVFAQFGFPAFLVRYVARAKELENTDNIRMLIRSASQIVLMLALSIVICVGAWTLVTTNFFDEIPKSALLCGLILIPLMSTSAALSGAIRGFGNVIYGQLPDEICRPLIFLGFLVSFYSLGISLTPESALFAHAIASFIAMLLAWATLKFLSAHLLLVYPKQGYYFTLLKQSFPFVLLAGAQVLNFQADVIMLGFMASTEEIGQYRVAVQIVEGMGVILFALSISMAPQIARLHAKNDWLSLQRLLVESHRLGTAIILPMSVIVSIYAVSIIEIMFGPEYIKSAQALTVLAIAKVAYSTVGFSGLALSLIGRPGTAAIVTMTAVTLNLALNFFLIPRYGMEGAAFATAVSQFLVAAATVVYIRSRLGIGISLFHRLRQR